MCGIVIVASGVAIEGAAAGTVCVTDSEERGMFSAFDEVASAVFCVSGVAFEAWGLFRRAQTESMSIVAPEVLGRALLDSSLWRLTC